MNEDQIRGAGRRSRGLPALLMAALLAASGGVADATVMRATYEGFVSNFATFEGTNPFGPSMGSAASIEVYYDTEFPGATISTTTIAQSISGTASLTPMLLGLVTINGVTLSTEPNGFGTAGVNLVATGSARRTLHVTRENDRMFDGMMRDAGLDLYAVAANDVLPTRLDQELPWMDLT